MSDTTLRAILALGILLAVGRPCSADDALRLPERPNLVFILADDLGYADLSCYGQSKFETPNIDNLAANGLRFTQAYAGAPVCSPSRCVLMTGLPWTDWA